MKELIIVFLLALVITPLLKIWNPLGLKTDQSEIDAQHPFNLPRKIVAQGGVVGCLSRESFAEFAKFSAEKNFAKMKELTNEGLCDYFANGLQVMGQKGSCGSENKSDELFAFIPQGKISKFYLPCSAIL